MYSDVSDTIILKFTTQYSNASKIKIWRRIRGRIVTGHRRSDEAVNSVARKLYLQ